MIVTVATITAITEIENFVNSEFLSRWVVRVAIAARVAPIAEQSSVCVITTAVAIAEYV